MQQNRSKLPASRLAMIGVGLVVLIVAAFILLGNRRDAGTELALGYMRSDLQGLLLAQETVRRETGKYMEAAEAAGHLSTPGVSTPAITLVGNGYTATVTHTQNPDLRCAVAVGTRNPLSRFADDGEIVCD